MKDLLTGGGAGMADSAVETILQAIADMQDKMNAEMDEKLKNYVPMPIYNDTVDEVKVSARRIAYNEGVLKELGLTTEGNAERIENNRKKLNKLQAEVDALKNNRSSSGLGLAMAEEVSVASELGGGDGASAGDLGSLKKMIQRIEGNLIRRIATLEGSLSKISSLEDEMVDVKLSLNRALAPKDPLITREDVDKWDRNCKKTGELEELIKQLQKEIASMDGAKIKTDILNLFKIQQTFVTKPQIEDINENARKM